MQLNDHWQVTDWGMTMRNLLGALVTASCMGAATTAIGQDTVRDLQHLLDNAGYNVFGQDGVWGGNSRKALTGFAQHYALDIAVPEQAPTPEEVQPIFAAANAAVDADHALFPTIPLPENYYVGLATQWYFNIHNWAIGTPAIVNRDGVLTSVPVRRWFEPIEDDLKMFGDAGVKVMRMQLGMEGMLFHRECPWMEDLDLGVLDDCYIKAFAEARSNDWELQFAELESLTDNPVIRHYLNAVEYWNENGFHVMVVPSDFFTGDGSAFDGSAPSGPPQDPLLHRAVVNDPMFQSYFPKFAGALVAEMRARDLNNVSFQSLNETRFCRHDGRPLPGGLGRWRALERAVFDAVRIEAPRMSLVSTAVCTAGDHFILGGGSYSQLATVVPVHHGLDDVTYALHLYTPRALMLGTAQNALYEPDTLIRYPFKRIAPSAARNEEAQYYIREYNRLQPGPDYFEQMFADIGAFARNNGIRVMFTELNAPKPDFGVPREDRVALIRDLVTFGKTHDVPIIHFGTLNAWGLSSCPHTIRSPDHRYDPALLNIIAFGNDVAGADPSAPLEPIEVQCGTQ